MEYTGTMRTGLRPEERSDLKKIASSKGMTSVGFVDSILRKAIDENRREKEAQHGTTRISK